MTPRELEHYLTAPDYFVAHSTNASYGEIMFVLASTQEPCAVGYHRDYGWFVLADSDPGGGSPRLVWSQKDPDR